MTFQYGSEFLVNTTTPNGQYESVITALADGRFVVTWRDSSTTGDDTSSLAIRAQVFNADGTLSGAEFLVNTTTSGAQLDPSITGLADGRFVITWTDFSGSGGDTSGLAIRAQVFNADGTVSGAEFLVNTTIASGQVESSVTSLADGRFVVSWTDQSATGGDTSGQAIRAQVFNADGSVFGAEFLVNTSTANSQAGSSITALTDGRFVISWTDESVSGGDTSGKAIRAQIFNADGTISGAEFLVNTTTAGDQYRSSVTALADGRFVVSWRDASITGDDISGDAVRAQVYNADGSTSGAEFLVNSTTLSNQINPSVVGLADGRFVVSWTDASASGGDTSGNAIRLQVFNIDGSQSGEEILVNSTTAGNQYQCSISALADGRFVVTWTDFSATGGDTSNAAIRGQIFDPRETAVTLSGSTLDDDFVGTRYGDTMYGFLGDDEILGRSGDDFLFGELGHDTLKGGSGSDRLYGGDGNDVLRGNFGADVLFGGDGEDNLKGGFGIDFMDGGNGDDTYIVDVTRDIVVEGASGGDNDQVRSSKISLNLANYANVEDLHLTGSLDLNLTGNNSANSLTGNDGANKLTGKGGADKIDGQGGDDVLVGNGGADKLTGGMGRDKLTGGSQADQFIFNDALETGITGATRDKITDFKQAQGDLIDLSGIDAISGVGNQAFTFIGDSGFSSTKGELRFTQTATKTFVQGDIDGDGVRDFVIELTGQITLTAGDFVL